MGYSEGARDSAVRTIAQSARGRRFCLATQCLPTAWMSIPTDPLRFFLPFEHHLLSTAEASVTRNERPGRVTFCPSYCSVQHNVIFYLTNKVSYVI
jgi:hypothetical protein